MQENAGFRSVEAWVRGWGVRRGSGGLTSPLTRSDDWRGQRRGTKGWQGPGGRQTRGSLDKGTSQREPNVKDRPRSDAAGRQQMGAKETDLSDSKDGAGTGCSLRVLSPNRPVTIAPCGWGVSPFYRRRNQVTGKHLARV